MRLVNLAVPFLLFAASLFGQPAQPWTAKQANNWYNLQPWLVGSNYIPASAINEFEMLQKDTFDPARINRELQWAQDFRNDHHACLPARHQLSQLRQGR